MKYGQFCPIAKATEILGEKWTILIVRELLIGGRRFNELQRGLGDISPALLTSRLKSLEEQGMIVRRKLQGQKGFEYYPTEACEALLPVLVHLGEWGLCWARHTVLGEDIDPEFLMYYLERSINPAKLIGDQTVIRFHFTDIDEQKNWWLLVKGEQVDLCLKDPGKDVDVYFTCSIVTMHDVWMGDRTYRDAIKSGDLFVEGEAALTRNISAWLTPSIFANSPRTPVAA
ncbi:MAG: winged helix-turn-helix transcriptional regulator, partial [Pseudomonadota bacterium]